MRPLTVNSHSFFRWLLLFGLGLLQWSCNDAKRLPSIDPLVEELHESGQLSVEDASGHQQRIMKVVEYKIMQ